MRFEHTILWHVLPLAFTGAEPTAADVDGVQHRLPALTAWFDHAIELGANGLQLGPVFAAETHGYDTTDHFRIDPRLGDDADFDALVREAHGRGLQVVLDGVFNHVGRSFERFRRAEAGDAESARWSRWTTTSRRCWTTWSPCCGTGWTAASTAGASTPPTRCRPPSGTV